ncbi:hypothetical protein [Burkholderia glumae]|uniref:hypothetical protein n=1 Tax=Burkholderia glumae TaxID=337 RepID=UPI003BA182FF
MVDGDPILRLGVGALLARSKNGARVAEIAPGESIRNVEVGAAQLVTLVASGRLEYAPERVREIRSHAPDVPLLVLASGADDDNAIRMLRAGATSYVRHSADIADLLAAIDATCRRQRFLGRTWRRGCRTGCCWASASGTKTCRIVNCRCWFASPTDKG